MPAQSPTAATANDQPAAGGGSYVAAIRRANLLVVMALFPSNAAFCRVTGASSTHISQILSDQQTASRRSIGGAFARKLEDTLQLPRFTFDKDMGVAPLLWELVDRLAVPPELVARAEALVKATSVPAPRAVAPGSSMALTGLRTIQVAALEALRDAMRTGRVSDAECLALLNRWLSNEESAAAE